MGDLTPVHSIVGLVQARTPLKRLGLSRKRKITDSPCNSPNKIQLCSDTSPNTNPKLRLPQIQNIEPSDEKIDNVSCGEVIQNKNDENVDYGNKVFEIQKRIQEKKDLIEDLRKKNSKIPELEELIVIWKKGCKSAYLRLNQLIEERQNETIKPRDWLKNLGIWKVMMENFHNDLDICLSDDNE